MPLAIEQMREHLAQAEQHIAKLKRHITQQQRLVDGLKNPVREEAVQMLTILQESLPILEKHREFIRTWLEERG